MPLEMLGPALTDAWCSYYERCGVEPFPVSHTGGCRDEFGAVLANEDAAVTQAGVQSGTIRYDPEQMGRCLATIAKLACGAVTPVDMQCASSVDGTVPSGGACNHDLECAGDSYCDDFSTCPGTCTRRVTTRCFTGRLTCPAGYYCVGGESLPGTGDHPGSCSRLPALGEPCGYCRTGLVCDEPEPGRGGRCAYPPVKKLGEPCRWGIDSCAGGSCSENDDPDGPAYVCAGPVASGGNCSSSLPDRCPSGEFCKIPVHSADGPTPPGICTPLALPGEPCDPDYTATDCAGRARCHEGVCTTFRDNGEPCTERDDCVTGRCANGICAAPTCDTL